MNKIAIDIGSGMTKGKSNGVIKNFRSTVGSYKSEGFIMGGNPKDIINIKGERWIAGDGADNHVKQQDLENSLSKKWHKSNGYKILFYRMVSELYPEGLEGELALCTGAPVRYFQHAKKDIVNSLAGKHRFKSGDVDYDFHIDETNIELAPQVVGLYFAELELDKDIPNEMVGYIDFGTYTSGFAMFKGSDYVKWGEGGEEIGGGPLAHKVQSLIENDFGIQVSISAVLSAIEKGSLKINGIEENLSTILNKAAREIMQPLTKNLKEKWGDSVIDRIVVGGGYGQLFFSAVKSIYPYAEIASGDAKGMMGVVNGYSKFLEIKTS